MVTRLTLVIFASRNIYNHSQNIWDKLEIAHYGKSSISICSNIKKSQNIMNIIVDNLHVKKEVYLLTAKKQLGAVHMEVSWPG